MCWKFLYWVKKLRCSQRYCCRGQWKESVANSPVLMKYNFTAEELHFKLMYLIPDSILLSFTGKLISQTLFS